MTPPTIDQSVIERRTVSVADYNALFDPADEAGQQTFTAGFREGFIYALAPDGSEYSEVAADFDSSVDGVVLGEAWQAHRDQFFAHLPLAALPEIGEPLSPSPIAGKEDLAGLVAHVRRLAAEPRREEFASFREHLIAVDVHDLRLIADTIESLATPPAECVATPGEVGNLGERIKLAAKSLGAHMTLDNSAWVGKPHIEMLDQAATLLTQMEARVEEAEDAARILQNSLATAQRIIAKREASEMAQAAHIAALEKALELITKCSNASSDYKTVVRGIAARALLNPTPTEER